MKDCNSIYNHIVPGQKISRDEDGIKVNAT